jgi:hypothetical protein
VRRPLAGRRYSRATGEPDAEPQLQRPAEPSAARARSGRRWSRKALLEVCTGVCTRRSFITLPAHLPTHSSQIRATARARIGAAGIEPQGIPIHQRPLRLTIRAICRRNELGRRRRRSIRTHSFPPCAWTAGGQGGRGRCAPRFGLGEVRKTSAARRAGVPSRYSAGSTGQRASGATAPRTHPSGDEISSLVCWWTFTGTEAESR